MEFGAFFILVLVIAVVALGGFLLYGVAWKLRNQKLDPREDKLEREPGVEGSRPEHVRVSNEQRKRFVTHR